MFNKYVEPFLVYSFASQSATQPFLVSSRNAPPRKEEEYCVTTLKKAV